MNRKDVMKLVRFKARVRRSNEKKTVPRKPTHPYRRIRKTRFLRALEDTAGVYSLIAERLGVGVPAVRYCVEKREGWEDIRKAWEDERDRVADFAEQTISYAIRQRLDIRTALDAAKWFLAQKGKSRGFSGKQTVKVEGGEHPIRVEQCQIPVEALELPVELRTALLEAIEKKEKEVQPDED